MSAVKSAFAEYLGSVFTQREGAICSFVSDQIVSRGIEYIYVMNNADADYPGNIAAESYEQFGVALECGHSYYVDRSGEDICFVEL